MAQRKQLTWTELRVGIFVLIAMVILAITTLYVTGADLLSAKYRLRTYLPEVEGLKTGAPVRLDGVQIGNVDSIRMNPAPKNRNENIEVIMRIDRDFQKEIRADSRASLITEGLLGNRYVTIERGFLGDPLQTDAIVPGKEEASAKLIVERGAKNFIVLNRYPYTAGHVMVVPYAHEAELSGVDAATLSEMMLLAQSVQRALAAAYQPEGYNLGMNLGRCAGAGVLGHLHLHVLPRWTGDANFMTTVGETRHLPEDLSQTFDKLKRALA